MQWLIDLVIEAIGVPPTYIDRGDPAAADFAHPFFTLDAAWHDLDLSAIVPAGAIAVAISFRIRANVANAYAQFRENGNVNLQNKTWFYTQVANVYYAGDMICTLDANRIIEYRFPNVGWNSITLVIKGWWL